MTTARIVGLVIIATLALNLVQPPFFAWPAAVVGCGALFLLWSAASPVQAALFGGMTGFLYFAGAFWWVGAVAGKYFGPFPFLCDVGSAIGETPAFLLSAIVTSLLRTRRGFWPAIGASAAFALCECLRAIGVLGVPSARIGVGLIDSPLAAVAMYAGTPGVTFVAFFLGTLFALIIFCRRRRSAALLAAGLVCGLLLGANVGRSVAPPPPGESTLVGAVQANVDQWQTWTPTNLDRAIHRYLDMTTALADEPAVVLWPEAAIPAIITVPRAEGLRRTLAGAARNRNAMLVVGAASGDVEHPFNSLFFYSPSGALAAIYSKRQLFPFAESLPFEWLRGFPFMNWGARYQRASDPTVVPFRTLRLGPLICWEASFEDIAHAQIERGANVWIVASDDAWFDGTAGPYEQAQAVQMLALETGRYVLRAGATGISGIIAPDGRFTVKTALDTQAGIVGRIGPARDTLFARLGPAPVAWGLALLVVAAFASPPRAARPADLAVDSRSTTSAS